MNAVATLSHVHRFVPAGDPTVPPLLLLHGTGGDENDLLPLGAALLPGAALVSPRGRVLENGMPRFFRRLAEGVFDEADVRLRAGELAGFVEEARVAYGIGTPVVVGFSNGANIAAAVLTLHPEALAGAVLIRPMVPLGQMPAADLAGKPVLILSGAMDPIARPDEARRLAASLAERGAAVEHRVLPAGHGLSQADVAIAKEWLVRRAAGDAS
ncbi:alpha/beta hydrolase [Aureimonas leprariae]|uniref:Alpha/beta hydrolase n=1 Tax=Plantimonas leprariae TaxID=2615207 RepID=A0A7V7PLR2_9HYPH|nr:alpha/beta hydrolase [Aureimonas leprariae]KAB0677385.1 alpha/beta hydrolase [Aureimonas leprariae]